MMLARRIRRKASDADRAIRLLGDVTASIGAVRNEHLHDLAAALRPHAETTLSETVSGTLTS
jgi:hypothetical protein